ncbi:P-loop containing nucleoside triphosphate hydrolase protein [Gigaspora rosea]|uniref:P-loop containing nucleoside triphosphate hydrolase protein n=1 Tax=Gigaspora rosea TaxID=44941 RepID=A0A397UMS6_9GLOM|nr:P-loop containing nucleoside triphosphate hydrolase protein [Gigaspora rosea]
MTKGTWKDYMQLITKTSTFQVINSTQMGIGCPSYLSSPEEIEQYSNELQNYPKVIEKFENNNGITLTTLLAYKVGIATYCNIKSNSSIKISRQDAKELCITFPRMAPCFDDQDQDNVLKYKVARIKAYSVEDNEFITFDPPSVHSGLFGYHLIPLECETIILTGNEYDAMTVYQETQIPATCLPNNGYQLPIEILPLLERFSKIYIWLNDDVQGQDAAEKFAQKLGIDRCLIVNTRCNNFNGPINASQALIMGKNLNEILSLAKPLQHEQILNFDNLKEAVYREVINPGQVRGISSKDLPALTQILKGHRPGELTIFTGPTGSGKTTILSQLSLDYCKSGVSTLWGSFEIPNIRLAKKMLTQFAGEDLSKNPGEFMNWAQKFQQLPMYFLKFFGSTEVSTVIDAMNHAIYAFDVQHIIIDNLQFMISEQGKFTDRWELQDRTISAFRRFATEKNVHITMVVHPKKDSRELLDMSSIFGSAKISQEADNVIILQKIESEDGDERYLHIKKNRFDGTLGAIPIEFIPDSLKIRHLRKKKFQEVNHLFAVFIKKVNRYLKNAAVIPKTGAHVNLSPEQFQYYKIII